MVASDFPISDHKIPSVDVCSWPTSMCLTTAREYLHVWSLRGEKNLFLFPSRPTPEEAAQWRESLDRVLNNSCKCTYCLRTLCENPTHHPRPWPWPWPEPFGSTLASWALTAADGTPSILVSMVFRRLCIIISKSSKLKFKLMALMFNQRQSFWDRDAQQFPVSQHRYVRAWLGSISSGMLSWPGCHGHLLL